MYPDGCENVINTFRQLGVLPADDGVGWYSGQVAALVAVDGLSGVVLAQQLILGLFGF